LSLNVTPNIENITRDDIITTMTKIIYGKYVWKKSVDLDIELYITHIDIIKLKYFFVIFILCTQHY